MAAAAATRPAHGGSGSQMRSTRNNCDGCAEEEEQLPMYEHRFYRRRVGWKRRRRRRRRRAGLRQEMGAPARVMTLNVENTYDV